MPDLQLRYHVHSEQEPEVKEQQQDERRDGSGVPITFAIATIG